MDMWVCACLWVCYIVNVYRCVGLSIYKGMYVWVYITVYIGYVCI